MIIMITEVYEALKAAGAPEDKAREAAQMLAEPKEDSARLDRIENDISTFKSDVANLKTDVAGLKIDVACLKTDIAKPKADIHWMKYLVGGTFFAVMALLIRSIWSGLPQLAIPCLSLDRRTPWS